MNDVSKLQWPRDGKRASGLIDGPAGALEVDVDLPGGTPRGFALICHPHPQQGGTKDNKVVYMMARAAVKVGLAAVRFNFRGVGASGGEYDAGRGEIDDARAVLDWAREASGLDFAALAGFSFGSAVAMRLAAADGAPSLVTVGFPTAYFDDEPPRPNLDWLALYGDADDVIDVERSIRVVRELEPAVTVQILEGAGHFLHGRLSELRDHVSAFWQAEDEAGEH